MEWAPHWHQDRKSTHLPPLTKNTPHPTRPWIKVQTNNLVALKWNLLIALCSLLSWKNCTFLILVVFGLFPHGWCTCCELLWIKVSPKCNVMVDLSLSLELKSDLGLEKASDHWCNTIKSRRTATKWTLERERSCFNERFGPWQQISCNNHKNKLISHNSCIKCDRNCCTFVKKSNINKIKHKTVHLVS